MNILLVCAQGASTSLVVEAMKKSLKENEKNWLIEAHSVQEIKDIAGKYDVIMIAPQIRFQKKRIEEIANTYHTQVMDINPMDYGSCNGEKILNSARISYTEGS